MSPQRPIGKGPPRRLGLPKRPVERSAPPASDTTDQPGSSSDLTAIVNILQSAMSGATDAAPTTGFGRRRHDREPVEEPLRPIVPKAADTVAADASSVTPAEGVAFDEVARSLAAAEACVPLLAQSTGLMRLAALDVVKAETTRAGGLLQLLRYLRGDVNPPPDAVSSSALIQRVTQATDSERRLRGIALTMRSSVSDVTFTGDETLLANTLLALLLTTFALVEGIQNARVTLSVTANDDGEVGLAVSQDHVAAPAAWSTRAGSDELTGDAATIVQGIAMCAAARVAREWSGRFAVASGERSSILTLWLPALAAAASQPPH